MSDAWTYTEEGVTPDQVQSLRMLLGLHVPEGLVLALDTEPEATPKDSALDSDLGVSGPEGDI